MAAAIQLEPHPSCSGAHAVLSQNRSALPRLLIVPGRSRPRGGILRRRPGAPPVLRRWIVLAGVELIGWCGRKTKQAQIEELLKARGAGQYLPPHKLRMLEEAVTDKTSPEYQRLTWDALKKSINGQHEIQ